MELSVELKRDIELLQKTLINSESDKVFVDKESLKVAPIKHSFSDQLYMRQMKMPSGSLIVSAMHHTDHFWFLMTGRILVTTNGETIEHIAPCFEKSLKGAKRLIECIEECVFINVHKNPTNTRKIKEIEQSLYSFTIEEYNKKEKLCQQ